MQDNTQQEALTGSYCVCPDRILQTETLANFLTKSIITPKLTPKIINIARWRTSHNRAVHLNQSLHTAYVLGRTQRLSQLPVSLTVQLIRLYKEASTTIGRIQQDQVGRYSLILANLDNLTNFKVFCFGSSEDALRGAVFHKARCSYPYLVVDDYSHHMPPYT